MSPTPKMGEMGFDPRQSGCGAVSLPCPQRCISEDVKHTQKGGDGLIEPLHAHCLPCSASPSLLSGPSRTAPHCLVTSLRVQPAGGPMALPPALGVNKVSTPM